jgi:hypothetical protein
LQKKPVSLRTEEVLDRIIGGVIRFPAIVAVTYNDDLFPGPSIFLLLTPARQTMKPYLILVIQKSTANHAIHNLTFILLIYFLKGLLQV